MKTADLGSWEGLFLEQVEHLAKAVREKHGDLCLRCGVWTRESACPRCRHTSDAAEHEPELKKDDVVVCVDSSDSPLEPYGIYLVTHDEDYGVVTVGRGGRYPIGTYTYLRFEKVGVL